MPCGRIGPTELLLILLICVLLFGANKLPEIGKGLGLGIRKFKDAVRDGEDESKRADKKDGKDS